MMNFSQAQPSSSPSGLSWALFPNYPATRPDRPDRTPPDPAGKVNFWEIDQPVLDAIRPIYVPLDTLSDSVYKKVARSDTTFPEYIWWELFQISPAMPSLALHQDKIRSASDKIFSRKWGRGLQIINLYSKGRVKKKLGEFSPKAPNPPPPH